MKNSKRKAKRSSVFPLLLVLTILGLGVLTLVLQTEKQQNLYTLAMANCDVAQADLTHSQAEIDFMNQINAFRAQNNITPPLALDPLLRRPAKWFVDDVAKRKNSTTQVDSLGRNTETRIRECGVVVDAFGESIGVGPAAQALNAWKSGTTKDILLDPAYRKAGLAQNGTYTILVVAGDFVEPEQSLTGIVTPLPTQSLGTQPPAATQPTAVLQAPIATAVPTFTCLGSCPLPTVTEVPKAIAVVPLDPTPTPCVRSSFNSQFGGKKGGGKKGGGGEPVVDEPVVDAPVVDAPVVDEPVVNEPVVDAPVVDAPVVDEPVVNEPVADEPDDDAQKSKVKAGLLQFILGLLQIILQLFGGGQLPAGGTAPLPVAPNPPVVPAANPC